jgi:hypothetical protein
MDQLEGKQNELKPNVEKSSKTLIESKFSRKSPEDSLTGSSFPCDKGNWRSRIVEELEEKKGANFWGLRLSPNRPGYWRDRNILECHIFMKTCSDIIVEKS